MGDEGEPARWWRLRVGSSGGERGGVGRSELPVSSAVRLPTGRNEGLP